MDARTELFPVVRTKLYVPARSPDHLRRERLLELLDASLASPLTLVSAPAGYGKSELLCDWARSRSSPIAWISLDETDGDLRQFLSYLVSALENVSPGACPELSDLLSGPELAPIAVVGRHLINDLDALDDPYVIVLDDYHRLEHASPVHELLGMLLEYPPPDMHLALSTRIDPPLKLTSLRAGNRVAEIRLQDLRFTRPETAEFLSMKLDRPVSDAAIDNLNREVEGWAVGLRLVCLALRHANDPDAVLTALRGGIPHTQEYLLNEVLKELSPAVRDCLLKTSILDRFCTDLIETLCCGNNQPSPNRLSGQTLIDLLQSDNLFSIALDSEGRWFRYHHLFQSILRRQLELEYAPADIGCMHRAAGAWLETHGEITQAIVHLLAAGDVDGAASLVERHRFEKLDNDQSFVVAQWLELLPADIRRQRLGLLIAETCVAYYQYRFADIAAGVERIESRFDDDALDAVSLSELDLFRAFLAYWQGDGEKARRCSERALTASPRRAGAFAGEIRIFVALSRHMTGDGDGAIAFLEAEAMGVGSNPGDPFAARVFGAQAIIHVLGGRLTRAARAGTEADYAVDRCRTPYAEGWSHYLRALPHLHAFDLESALEHLLLAKERAMSIERVVAVDAMAGLALAYQLMGRPDEALRTVEELAAFARALADPEYITAAESCRARCALLRGDTRAAMTWARSVDAVPHAPSMVMGVNASCLTHARIRIAAGGDDDVRAALEMLAALRPELESLHMICQVVEVAVLECLALARLGCDGKALEALRDAVELAMPGGWIRPFAELGRPMAGLLERLHVNGPEGEFIGGLLASCTTAGASAPSVSSSLQSTGQRLSAHDGLTNREIDILELLSQRLRNKEIAARLYISTHTVNDHLKHIYQKLGVSSRRQAVTRAQDAGILPAP